jgi:hypothetical protein
MKHVSVAVLVMVMMMTIANSAFAKNEHSPPKGAGSHQKHKC